VAAVAGLIFAAAPIGVDHPVALALIWLLGIVAAVGAVSSVLIRPHAETDRAEGHQPTARKTRTPAPKGPRRGMIAVGLVVAAAMAVALFSQWHFHVAVYADRAGSLAFSHGDFAGGLGDAELAASDVGYEPTYRYHLGLAYLSLARAQANSSQALSLLGTPDPRSVDPATAVLLNAPTLTRLGLEEIRSAVSLAPRDAPTWKALGRAYAGLHQARAALQAYRRAAQLSLQNPLYIADEATAELALKAPQTALNLARTAVALDSKYWYSRYALALTLHSLGRRHEARRQAIVGVGLAAIPHVPLPVDQIQELHRLAKTG
jgi:tetratricopeptide (TPR) repeat protein